MTHKRLLATLTVVICLLILTAVVSYNLGMKDQAKKSKSTSSTTFVEQLKKAAASKKSTQSTPAPKTASSQSSGFYRLSGIVAVITKDSLALKLSTGNTVTLAINEATPYYQDGTKGKITTLKKDVTIVATGTINTDGTFKVTAIQKSTN